MGLERLLAPEARLFLEEERLQDALFEIGNGSAAVYSCKSPEKETPNEDAACVMATGEHSAILAVADGVGGARAGQQASEVAIESLVKAVEASIALGAGVREGILNGFEAANQAVLELGLGAATTLAVVELDGRSVRPYHVGDSLILVTGQRGKIKLQTISHSPVGYGVESGFIDEADAMYHEERHVVSNVIGSDEMRIDVGSAFELAPSDRLLLASDGLSDNLHNEEIVECIRKGPLKKVVRELEQHVLARMEGGNEQEPSKPDDLTFVVFRLNRAV